MRSKIFELIWLVMGLVCFISALVKAVTTDIDTWKIAVLSLAAFLCYSKANIVYITRKFNSKITDLEKSCNNLEQSYYTLAHHYATHDHNKSVVSELKSENSGIESILSKVNQEDDNEEEDNSEGEDEYE